MSTSVCVGIAAAGGLSILSSEDSPAPVVEPPAQVAQPPVVVQVDPVDVPEPNSAPRRPEPAPDPGGGTQPPPVKPDGDRLTVVKEERRSSIPEPADPWRPGPEESDEPDWLPGIPDESEIPGNSDEWDDCPLDSGLLDLPGIAGAPSVPEF